MIEDYPPSPGSFREFHTRIGSIPLDRILMRPPPGTATESDLLMAWRSPEQHCCELVDGTLIDKYTGWLGSALLRTLIGRLGNYVHDSDCGVTLLGNLPFRFRSDLIRVPSMTYTAWENLPLSRLPDEEIASFSPTLTIDMLCQWGTMAEMERKVAEYFKAGVRRSWVIDTQLKIVRDYSSGKRFKELKLVDSLDGGKVLPGFRLSLGELFASIQTPRKRISNVNSRGIRRPARRS